MYTATCRNAAHGTTTHTSGAERGYAASASMVHVKPVAQHHRTRGLPPQQQAILYPLPSAHLELQQLCAHSLGQAVQDSPRLRLHLLLLLRCGLLVSLLVQRLQLLLGQALQEVVVPQGRVNTTTRLASDTHTQVTHGSASTAKAVCSSRPLQQHSVHPTPHFTQRGLREYSGLYHSHTHPTCTLPYCS
jgi:hypothetical protein